MLTLSEYHTKRRGIQASARPAGPAELAPLAAELERALDATVVLEDVEVAATDDVDRLVIAMCRFDDDLGEQHVAGLVEELWQDRLRFGFWEAHATLVDDGHVEFQGATRAGRHGHCATIHIVARSRRSTSAVTASSSASVSSTLPSR